jgi:hypothetical protein
MSDQRRLSEKSVKVLGLIADELETALQMFSAIATRLTKASEKREWIKI